MTLSRTPGTLAAAFFRVVSVLGAERVAEVVGVSPRQAYRYGEPGSKPPPVAVEHVVTLEVACRIADGSTPFRDLLDARLAEVAAAGRTIGAIDDEVLDLTDVLGVLSRDLRAARDRSSAGGRALTPVERDKLLADLERLRREIDDVVVAIQAEGEGRDG